MINIGIIGAGRVVENRYVDVFNNELTGIKIVAVADPVKKKAARIAEKLGCQPVYSEIQLLQQFKQFRQENNTDVILICSESGNHYRHSLTALKAGKHVIVEKPPAMRPQEILEVSQLASEKGLMYACIFQNRFNPAMKKLKEAYDAGRFGKIVLSTVRLRWCRYQEYYDDGWHGTFRMDGGVLNQQAIHHVDALNWICGPVDAVNATMTRALNVLEAEDTAVATVKFSNGALGAIEATTAARPEDFEASLSIVGEKGMAVIGGIALNRIEIWSFIEPEAGDEVIPQKFSQDVPTGYGLSHGPLMQDIVNRLSQGNIQPPVCAHDVLPTIRLVQALYASDERQGWVNLKENTNSTRLGI